MSRVTFIVIASLCTALSWAEKPTKTAHKCPVEIGVLRDGGSFRISVPGHNGLPAITVYQDYSIGTKTPGQFYRSFGEKPLAGAELTKILDQIEGVLVAKYGEKQLLQWTQHPLTIGVHLTKKEWEALVVKPDGHPTIERLEVQEVLELLRDYRKSNKTEQDVEPDAGDAPE